MVDQHSDGDRVATFSGHQPRQIVSDWCVELDLTALDLLQDRQREIQYRKNEAYVGRKMEILVDDKARTRFRLTGRTSNNKIVNFDGPDILMGRLIQVEITGFSPNSLKGNWIQSGTAEHSGAA